MSAVGQTRVLQMASQIFPIGGYSYSQGLEHAVDCKLVIDEASVQQWISDVLLFSLSSYEVPCLEDMHEAWGDEDVGAVKRLNDEFLATRESAEFRSAIVQMGFSLTALIAVLPDLSDDLLTTLRTMAEPSLPCAWSGLATVWSIAPADSITAYLWSWAENQVLAAMKSVPIGQASGQRILLNLGRRIEDLLQRRGQSNRSIPQSNFAPGLAIASCRHETQYSRLFRS